MKVKADRQSVLSIRITREMRERIESLRVKMSLNSNKTLSITDVVEAAINYLAAKERVK